MQQRTLDNYLRSFRRKAGLSQEEISFLLGTKAGTHISRYELGRREPSLDAALALEAIFGVPVRDLFRGRFEKVEEAVKARAELLLQTIKTEEGNAALAALAAIISRTRFPTW